MRVYSPQHEDARELAEQGEEVWVPHPRYGHLAVSNLGRLAHERGFEVKTYVNRVTGYLHIVINRHTRPYIHQLVMEVFEPGSRGRIYRYNSDRSDNRLCNLYRR